MEVGERRVGGVGGQIGGHHGDQMTPHPHAHLEKGDGSARARKDSAEIAGVGWQVLATSPLSEAAWRAYYDPLLARCDKLEAAGTSDSVAAAIAAARKEASDWRAVAHETGYMLYIVRPT